MAFKQMNEGDNKEELIKGVEAVIKTIDNVMAKSPGLTQDTVIFSGTSMESTLEAGDISMFKGFKSCSYQMESAEAFNYEDRYMITIYANKGQKGIAMNVEDLGLFTGT